MGSDARQAGVSVVRRLRRAGHVAYFAGGCVRDELLALHPKDFDVATDATPDRVRALFARTAHVGAAFGVVLVQDFGRSIEVATFRSDGPYTDRRRPDHVVFSTPEADARRRDFTINALFLDPLDADRVIDLVGGRADLDARVLRAVGDPHDRLKEDHLRALRGVRLAARLGLRLDDATRDAILAHADDPGTTGLGGVSRERIGDELRKILSHPSRVRGVELLESLHLDAPVLRLADLAPGGAHPVLGSIVEEDFVAALAAWLLDRGIDADRAETAAIRLRESLCLSNEERSGLVATLRVVGWAREWDRLGVASQRRLTGEAGFARGVACLMGIEPDLAGRIQRSADAWGPNPDPLVTGDDIASCGVPAGKRYKWLLDRLYDAQLEGEVGSREEGLELLRRLIV